MAMTIWPIRIQAIKEKGVGPKIGHRFFLCVWIRILIMLGNGPFQSRICKCASHTQNKLDFSLLFKDIRCQPSNLQVGITKCLRVRHIDNLETHSLTMTSTCILTYENLRYLGCTGHLCVYHNLRAKAPWPMTLQPKPQRHICTIIWDKLTAECTDDQTGHTLNEGQQAEAPKKHVASN